MSKQSSSPIPAPVADDTGLSQLVTEDQTLLLNVIDQLRELRISTVVPLPEIIVCGDQSSGKSSVLEAISRLSFPRGDTLCTTFATELALRRAPARKISVSIQPANTRDEHAKLHLSNFEPPSERIEDFEMVIKAAKDCLATSSLVSRNSFSEDTLRVEVSHPDWPQSTLVDLPGLIHSPNPGQSSADVRLVKDLVKRYMKRERSIILAVVSAGNDLANQEVLHLAQQIDPDGKRTLGVITKPDKTERGSEGEKVMINLAKNELTKFKLGWQVLKNRGYESRECTMDERDQQESEFFESSPWGRALEPTQLGVGALRNRLSELLLDQIRSALPEVVTNIRKKLNESEKSIEVLGPPRDTSPEKKKYLVNISRDFQRIVQQSLVGDYLDDFFYSSDLPQEATRRLRAALQNLNESFAKKMYDRGHKWEIRSVDSKCLLQPDSKHAPKIVSQDKYISLIKDMMDQNRGTELSGTFNPRLIGALFRQQSEKWSTIAEDHLESVLAVAKEHLTLTATHVAHKQTARNLQRGLINVEMEKKRKMLFGKLQELTKAYQRCHPITYSNHYSETLHRTREKQLLQGDPRIDLTNGQDLGILEPATEILGFMNAYYAATLPTFIDNVAVLAVEMCLVEGLEEIFSPSTVSDMGEETLGQLASEPANVQRERSILSETRDRLLTALEICEPHLPLAYLGTVESAYETQELPVLSPTVSVTPPSRFSFSPSTPQMATATPSKETRDPFSFTTKSNAKLSGKPHRRAFNRFNSSLTPSRSDPHIKSGSDSENEEL